MKKIVLAAAAISMLSGFVFAQNRSEINVKAGLANAAYNSVSYQGDKLSSDGFSASAGAEFLYDLNTAVKVGFGAKYVVNSMKNEYWNDYSGSQSLLPVYATLQLNPIPADKKIFFKGNIGYNPLKNDIANFLGVPVNMQGTLLSGDNKGGLYWGAEAGYEFKSGVIFGVSYDTFYFDYAGMKIVNGTLGATLGYKFRL